MLIKEAIVKHLQDICKREILNITSLQPFRGVTPSTVYSLMDENRKDLSVITLKKLCDGLDISISDFFDDDLFRGLEQEIK